MPALKEPVRMRRGESPAGRAGHLFDPGGRRTLDDLLTELLADASAGEPATCPVCEAPALSSSGEASGEARLACSACGSRLD